MRRIDPYTLGFTATVDKIEYARLAASQNTRNNDAFQVCAKLPIVRKGTKWRYVNGQDVFRLCNDYNASLPAVLSMLRGEGIRI